MKKEMKIKEITTRTKTEKILKYFREAGVNDAVNLRTSKGFICLVGGILSKVENDNHFIALDGKWVKVN